MPENLEIKRAMSRGMRTLMSEKKFDDITVAEICEVSAVSRRTFYRYFQDKYELLNFVHYDDLCRFFDDKSTPHAMELYPAICQHMYDNRQFYIHAFDVTGPSGFREFCIERLYIYLLRDFGVACETDAERRFYITRILEGAFDSIQLWLKSEPCDPPEEYVARVVRSMTRFSGRFAAIALLVSDKMGYSS